MNQRLKKLNLLKLKPPIYGKRTLKIALEFGIILSEVAKERDIHLTKEISARAEDILIAELKTKGLNKTALNFVPLILAALEV